MYNVAMFGPTGDPLADDSAVTWNSLVDAIGPSSLLVLIDGRLAAALRAHVAAEDILQEALLHAWRDRRTHRWQGVRAFRAWVVAIINNRICDVADRVGAQKRGGGRPVVSLDAWRDADASGSEGWAGPFTASTPSRVAAAREEAELMHAALRSLADDVREVVRLRLFEQLTIDEIATALGIGASAVRHRFRKGAEAYERAIRAALTKRGPTTSLAPGVMESS